MYDRGGPFDANNTQELPFELPQCFYRAHPIEDCAWKYHPRTARVLKHNSGEKLLAELDNHIDLELCDPKMPSDCAYAMYTSGDAGPGASASALRAAGRRAPNR